MRMFGGRNVLLTVMVIFMLTATAEKEIPEYILERLRNVKDLSTFSQVFTLTDLTAKQDGPLERNFGDTKDVTLENQPCKPRPVVVEVPQPLETNSFHYPYFMQIYRCSGGCGVTHFTTKCVGKVQEKIQAKVVAISWSNDERGNEIPAKLTHVELMNETECQCVCKYDGSVCNRFQYWDGSSCRCKCSSWGCTNNFISHPRTCCHCLGAQECSTKHIWDQTQCACVCRRRSKPCRSPRKIRDKHSCRCVCPSMLMCRHGFRLNRRNCECEEDVFTNA